MLHSNKAMEKLHNGMQNLCANFLGHLVQNGLYEAVRYTLYTNSMQTKGVGKRTTSKNV